MAAVAPQPRPKKPSREEKKALTRARLLDAAATVFARRGFADRLDGCAREHLHSMGGQFGMHQGAQLRVDSGQYLGQLFHLAHS